MSSANLFRSEIDSDLPRVINPDDPSRLKPAQETTNFVLYLTTEEAEAVERLAARADMPLGELGLRALAYGLTVMEAIQQQVERRRLKN